MPHHGSYNAVLPTAESANPDVLNLLNAIKEDQKESVNTVRQFATRIDNLQARQDKSEMEQERAFNAKDYKSNNFEPNKLRTPITGQQTTCSNCAKRKPRCTSPMGGKTCARRYQQNVLPKTKLDQTKELGSIMANGKEVEARTDKGHRMKIDMDPPTLIKMHQSQICSTTPK